APEVILGVPYGTPLDMWAAGCTLYELYTGTILFPGKTNNDMLRLQMELKGKVSSKIIRKAAIRNEYFDENMNFLYQDVDAVTGNDVIKEIAHIKPAKTIHQLLEGRLELSPYEQEWESLFADVLERMLMTDPDKRITVSEALRH
ncbi:hypothetical protein SARC_13036, partial [Sphaeroforma arctica JP610]